MLIKTLGTLEIEGKRFASTKPLLLLVYLALEGKKSKKKLAALLWPHSKNPDTNLDTDLGRTRKALPNIIQQQRSMLYVKNIDTDIQIVKEACDRGALDVIEAHYHGSFLSNIFSKLKNAGADLEEWIRSERKLLTETVWSTYFEQAEANPARAGELMARCYQLLNILPANQDRLKKLYCWFVISKHPNAELISEKATLELGIKLNLTEEEARRLLDLDKLSAEPPGHATEHTRRTKSSETSSFIHSNSPTMAVDSPVRSKSHKQKMLEVRQRRRLTLGVTFFTVFALLFGPGRVVLANILEQRGLNAQQKADHDKASIWLEWAVRIRPSDISARYNLALSYEDNFRNDEAIESVPSSSCSRFKLFYGS